jgi:hypothetical protein
MVTNFFNNWFRLKNGRPGSRFHDFYLHRQHQRGPGLHWSKVASLAVAIVVTALGALLIPAPGPGTGVFILGLGLLASEFKFAAHALDRVEASLQPLLNKIRPRWERIPGSMRVVIEISIGIASATLSILAYRYFMQ